MILGRAPDCDWVLDDRARLLSRQHCQVTLENGRVFVTDLSANGIFLNGETQRLERGARIEVEHQDSVRIGEYELTVLVETSAKPPAASAGSRDPWPGQERIPAADRSAATHSSAAPAAASNPFGEPEPAPIPAAAARPAPIPTGGSLAAFLEGADLDPSTMAGGDATAILRRAGRLYRQIITHVYDLLRDRSVVKAQFRAEQTMVTPANNNPFKSLMPDELAVRLLRSDQKGYLASEEAVEATFRDVKRHQMAVLSGMHRALAGLVGRLNPDEIEELLGKRSTMSIVTAGGKKAAAWDTYRAYFEQLERDIADLDRSSFMSDFRRGYEDRLRQLQNADL